MKSRWRFTPTEVFVLWPLLGISEFPYPFDVRASGDTTDAWTQLRRDAHQRLSAGGVIRDGRVDADVEAALLTLVRPRVTVDAYGFFGDQPESVVRVLGAHAGGPGVMAMQLPGPSEPVGGDLIVEVVGGAQLGPAQLGAAVAALLPAAPQGRQPALRLATNDVLRDQSDVLTGPVALTPSERGRAQLAALTKGPLAGAGQFGVSVFGGAKGVHRSDVLRWFDRPGDGRYLMSTDGAVTVRGADVATLAGALGEHLGRLSARV